MTCSYLFGKLPDIFIPRKNIMNFEQHSNAIMERELNNYYFLKDV